MRTTPKAALLTAPSLAITLVSGIFPSPLSHALLGAAHHGAPIAWIMQVVYPDTPKVFHLPEFLLDVAFWTLVCYLGYRIHNRSKD